MTGLLLGASSAGIAWAAGASPLWTAVIGAGIALIVWFGGRAIELIEDVIDAIT